MNQRTKEILNRRAGKNYTAAEVEYLEKLHAKRQEFYNLIDPVCCELYKLRVKRRLDGSLSPVDQKQFEKLEQRHKELVDGIVCQTVNINKSKEVLA